MQSLSQVLHYLTGARLDNGGLLIVALPTHAPATANVLLLFPHLSISLFLLLGNHRRLLYETYVDLHSFLTGVRAYPLLLRGHGVAPTGAAVLKVQLTARVFSLVKNCGIIFGPWAQHIWFFRRFFFRMLNLVSDGLASPALIGDFLIIWSLIFIILNLDFEVFFVRS